MSATLVIGGDVAFVNRAFEATRNGTGEGLFSEMAQVLRGADLTVVNLESPLVERLGRDIAPLPRRLGAPPQAAAVLKDAGVKAVTLANNHVLDYGVAGLEFTLGACRDNGIAAFGAGMNLAEARRPAIFEFKSLKVGLLGMCHHRDTNASPTRPGTNPTDVSLIVPDLLALARSVDYVVVLVHLGSGYDYPNPRMVRLGGILTDLGAHLVVFQHTHRPGCWQERNGSLSIYNQGNLLFDLNHPHRNAKPGWNDAFLVRVRIEPGRTLEWEVIPAVQCWPTVGLHPMSEAEADRFRAEMAKRSEEILPEGAVERIWRQQMAARERLVVPHLISSNRWFIRINRRVPLYKLLLSRRSREKLLDALQFGL